MPELIFPTARPVRLPQKEWLDIRRGTGGAGIDVGFPCEVLEIYADRVGDAFWCHQHPGMNIHRYRCAEKLEGVLGACLASEPAAA